MSNPNDTSKKTLSSAHADQNEMMPTDMKTVKSTPETATDSAPSKSKRWSFIQNDLEKALQTWQELEKSQSRLSPEEEQFEKIREIIGQLKNKLEQF